MASLAGRNRVAMISTTRVARNRAQMSGENGIRPITRPRPMSVAISTRRRSQRSTKTPATGPSSIVGTTRATMIPDRANAAARVVPRICSVSARIATTPIQSPRLEVTLA